MSCIFLSRTVVSSRVDGILCYYLKLKSTTCAKRARVVTITLVRYRTLHFGVVSKSASVIAIVHNVSLRISFLVISLYRRYCYENQF